VGWRGDVVMRECVRAWWGGCGRAGVAVLGHVMPADPTSCGGTLPERFVQGRRRPRGKASPCSRAWIDRRADSLFGRQLRSGNQRRDGRAGNQNRGRHGMPQSVLPRRGGAPGSSFGHEAHESGARMSAGGLGSLRCNTCDERSNIFGIALSRWVGDAVQGLETRLMECVMRMPPSHVSCAHCRAAFASMP
jgi:hypothetical protein